MMLTDDSSTYTGDDEEPISGWKPSTSVSARDPFQYRRPGLRWEYLKQVYLTVCILESKERRYIKRRRKNGMRGSKRIKENPEGKAEVCQLCMHVHSLIITTHDSRDQESSFRPSFRPSFLFRHSLSFFHPFTYCHHKLIQVISLLLPLLPLTVERPETHKARPLGQGRRHCCSSCSCSYQTQCKTQGVFRVYSGCIQGAQRVFRGVLGVCMVCIWCIYMHNGCTQVYVRL